MIVGIYNIFNLNERRCSIQKFMVKTIYLPSTKSRNPLGFLAKIDNATRVMSANEGSPPGPVSRSASKSKWEYANNPEMKKQSPF